jgi:quinol-cytochrome oxidoreductase complex cytochrome b subunit
MNLTAGAQRFVKRNLTLEDALPTRMPVYVNSVWYLFGATALMALVLLIVTGIVMSAFGPTWYHSSGAGHYVNSMHFWSTQLLFIGLVLHLAAKFMTAGWRDKRWSTWVWGLLSLAVAIFAGLTGFLLQTSWDSQWIAVQAKDAMNAIGIGGWFNTLNTGQMLTIHVAVVPTVAVIFIGIHLFLVRRDSPVKPIDGKAGKAGAAVGAGNAGAPPATSDKAGQL